MHNHRMFRLGAVALALTALVACSSQKGNESAGAKKSGGQVLAEVNGTPITTDDFKREMDTLPPYLKPMTETPGGKKQLLDTMVMRELILQKARQQGIDKSQEVADKLEDLKKRLIVEAFLKKQVEAQANISDADLQKYYDQNKERFRAGAQVRASHILVKTEQEAKDVLAQLKKGASFEELAKKYSIDAAGAKGGDLGWFAKGSMVPAFEKAVFALKEGKISGIVKTQFGYHIIKLTGKRPAGIRPFDEVKDQIKAALLPEKQQAVFTQLKDELKKDAKITLKDDALASLGIQAGTAATPPAPPQPQK